MVDILCTSLQTIITKNVPKETVDEFRKFVFAKKNIDISNLVNAPKKGRKIITPEKKRKDEPCEYTIYITQMLNAISKINGHGQLFLQEATKTLGT